jgi:predicted ferric reductase
MYKFIIIIIIFRVWMNFIYRLFNYDHSIYDDIK